MAKVAARAEAIRAEAGGRLTGAMRELVYAAAGLTGFAVETARDVVHFLVRRGQMAQEEGERLLREAEAASRRRVAAGRVPQPVAAALPAAEAPAPPAKRARKRTAAKRAAAEVATEAGATGGTAAGGDDKPAAKTGAKRAARRAPAKKAASKQAGGGGAAPPAGEDAPGGDAGGKAGARKRGR